MTTDWFEGAVRPDAVGAQLRTHVPELAEGRLGLLRCRVTRLRSVPPEGSWTATYELDLRDSATGLERTFAVQGILTPPDLPMDDLVRLAPFGVEGWSCSLPDLRLHLEALPFDDSLPGLSVITDPERGRALLERLLRSPGSKPSDRALTGCATTIASHKPGVRATVVCNLEYSGGPAPEDQPAAVVVKVHHDDEGSRAHQAMQALYESLGSSRVVRLARPLAYVPELRLSVQECVVHRWSLKDLFYAGFDSTAVAVWDELTDAMRATGAGLAALHGCGSPYGQPVTWADEFAILRAKHEKLAAVMPSLRERAGPALARMLSAAARAPEDPLGPAHHSFRPAQVLLNGGVSLIDLDKFCQAEPASDIAALTTKLTHMGVNKVDGTSRDTTFDRDARLAQLRTAFLEGYRRHAPVSVDRLVLWEAYEFLSLVHSAAKKMDRPRVDSCCLMLERHLRTHHL